MQLWKTLPTLWILLGLMTGMSVLSPSFLTIDNLTNVALAASVIGILAVGAALVIGAGGIDMSVGAVIALSASVAIVLAWGPDGSTGLFMIFLCLSAGLGVGLVNGSLAALTVFPPFIITLATMSIARGLGFILMDGRPVYGLPPEITFLGQGYVMGIPMPVILLALVAVTGHVLLTQTALGRHLLAHGDNPVATRATGINVSRLKIILYGLSGLTAVLAGLVFMGRLNTADPSAGLGYELTAITAAIIGGASLNGGRTSVIGAVIGALIMAVLQNSLNLLAIPSFYQYVVTGFVLLAAVSLYPQRGRA
jgi:ribose transport system permease protein